MQTDVIRQLLLKVCLTVLVLCFACLLFSSGKRGIFIQRKIKISSAMPPPPPHTYHIFQNIKWVLTWVEVCVEFHDVVYRNGRICEMCTLPEVRHISQHRSSDITVRWSDFTLINQFLIFISSTRLMLLVISVYLGGWTEGWARIPPFL